MPAIELFLRTIMGIVQQPQCLRFFNRIEQLRQDAGESVFRFRSLIGRACFPGRVTFAQLRFHELVKDAFGIVIFDGHVGLGAGVQGGAPAAVGIVDDEAFARRFDGAVIDFVTGACAVIQGDGFEFGCYEGLHSCKEEGRKLIALAAGGGVRAMTSVKADLSRLVRRVCRHDLGGA